MNKNSPKKNTPWFMAQDQYGTFYHGLKYWMAYVEEGTLNARVDARDEACVKSVKEIFEADGYEVEIVRDYDDKWIPVVTTKPFAA